ncbi:YdcF family protein [Mucilaginibacter daejeonensis]|uniref:YdcF family protein n=1 Tax=Mucilaginibacter daejeonensis TaxID=398049 RepID=UPI001D17ACFB|nr:YdcF family protein [Mucilaginibacter daejeonensis]UEG54165.1 YdcF family protein [Mucilaginibacter daejeonensis]
MINRSLYKYILLAAALYVGVGSADAQIAAPSATYKLVSGNDWVKAKNYYLLTLLEQDKAVGALLNGDAELASLARKKVDALNRSLGECKDALCLPGQIKLSTEEISLVSARLSALYKAGNALDKLVREHLMASGTYINLKAKTPAELLIKAWEQDAAAVNHTIEVYAEGKKPNYPQIDSISFDIKRKSYYTLMYDCSSEVAQETGDKPLFFQPALNAALTYLEVNERRNAADHEPMATTANRAAAEHVKLVKWASYPYSHILVPGAGPDNLTTPLSGEGMLRCKFAARQYFAGQAPFVVVSGGAVHSFKTKYHEAVEMRRYMINTLHLPVHAVIIEPHARHTTTNLRNDVRIAFRYGMPMAKPALIVTDKYQNDFIMNMDKRCMTEMGFVPYKLGKRLSDTALEFYPVITALQIDADEPMDP